MRVDSGLEAGGEVTPTYDPMVAKLIVWDADREQATAADAARAGRVRDRGPQDADPVPQRRCWRPSSGRNAETARDLLEDKDVAQVARVRAPPPPTDDEERGDGRADLHRRGLGQALRRQGHRRAARPARRRGGATARAAARKPPRQARARAAAAAARRRHARLAAAGQRLEGPRRAGPDRSRRASSSPSSRR